jgi:hypothetical protein
MKRRDKVRKLLKRLVFLMVVLTVTASPLIVLGWHFGRPIYLHRRAVNHVTKLGGDAGERDYWQSGAVDLSGIPLTDADIDIIVHLRFVFRVDATGTGITDEQVQRLSDGLEKNGTCWMPRIEWDW